MRSEADPVEDLLRGLVDPDPPPAVDEVVRASIRRQIDGRRDVRGAEAPPDPELEGFLRGMVDPDPPVPLDLRTRSKLLAEVGRFEDADRGPSRDLLPPPEVDAATDAAIRGIVRSRKAPGWLRFALPLAAGLLVGVFTGSGLSRTKGAGGGPDLGQLSLSGEGLRPTNPVRAGVGSGIRPPVEANGPVTVTWRVADPSVGRLLVWWVEADGAIVGIEDDGRPGGPPRLLDRAQHTFRVHPAEAGTLVVVVSTGIPPDASAVAHELGAGRVALQDPPPFSLNAFEFQAPGGP